MTTNSTDGPGPPWQELNRDLQLNRDLELLPADLPCSAIMKTDVVVAVEDQTVEEVARIMRDAVIGFVPVCTPEGEVVGTVTDRDLAIRVVAEGRTPQMCLVGEVMSGGVLSCGEDDPLSTAEDLMMEYGKSRIMVTGAGERLVGIISLSDIAVQETSERVAATLRRVAERESTPTPR